MSFEDAIGGGGKSLPEEPALDASVISIALGLAARELFFFLLFLFFIFIEIVLEEERGGGGHALGWVWRRGLGWRDIMHANTLRA